MTQPSPAPPAAPPPAPAPGAGTGTAPSRPPTPDLRRSHRQKMVAGVCGGLGRYCDIDPVIFRIVIGVLTVTGGIGLIFYGFAWLLIPLDGEDENELRRLLSGRVDGSSLIAVLLALVGCGLLLSMLGDDGTLYFATMLSIAVVGSAVWSQRRRLTAPAGMSPDSATAHATAEAPPETQAPPTPGGAPSWWRDPIVKDGTTGRVPGRPAEADYLWGPPEVAEGRRERRDGATPLSIRTPRPRGPRGISGTVFLFALLAGGLGMGLTWDSRPFGTSLEIGLAAALAVLGLGLVVSSFLGRTGLGTIFLAMVTAGLLAASAAVPKDITTEWGRRQWTPAAVASVEPRYELGSGIATLDLTGLAVPRGQTVRTSAEVGAGQLKVVVPEGVTVKVRATAGFGDISLPGEPPDEVNISPDQSRQRTLSPRAGSAPAGALELRLEIGVGQVEVTRAAS
ncbi:PspC domain-containing protein [Streptomyces sp. NPDC088147]|uniref:PspC domain-containing protein n=1 Tax=unclassified Streptomyces TaxID=2593676 RepID=UPI003802EDB6